MPVQGGERNLQATHTPEHEHDRASVAHGNNESMKQQEHLQQQEKPNK